MDKIKRICLWCSPRNISTTMMYSFAQRTDTKVVDEPLYGFYLKNTTADEYHPGAEEVIQSMETNGRKVIENMLNDESSNVLFFKQMTHHLLDLDLSFLEDTINIVLTRHPDEMIQSFTKVIDNPTPRDLGYPQQVNLVKYMLKNQINFTVVDSKQILVDPRNTLSKLCTWCDLPFEESMLTWKASARQEDGIWAKYWYANVHRSTGFIPYEPKSTSLNSRYKSLLSAVLPDYNFLMSYSRLS